MTIFTLFITPVKGQSYEPLDLAKKIFSKGGIKNLDNYVTDEYKGKPNGKDLQKESTTKFILLEQKENKAVVAMTVLDSLEKGFDLYLYFKKNPTWKMNAFRSLAMTGIIKQVKLELEKMTPQQVDNIIAESKEKKQGNFSMFTTKEDYEFRLGNTKLILELDDNIIKHFLENQLEFEKLKNLALNQLEDKDLKTEKSISLIESSKLDYQKLFVSSISTGGYELGNCINFLIGGMTDNTVGYIYVNNERDLPEMNSNRVIMIRKIGNGWYIYKTT